MLLKNAELEAIRAGTLSVVFRRWKRRTVKTGGTLKTAIGVLAIDRITQIEPGDISEQDARRAGFDSKSSLREALSKREGSIHRIELHYAGADPQTTLRADDQLSDEDVAELRTRLRRLDAASKRGPWTRQVLEAIARHPGLVARELAAQAGFERDWLKTNIRKLKILGLTISLERGYELAPRGKALLKQLQQDT